MAHPHHLLSVPTVPVHVADLLNEGPRLAIRVERSSQEPGGEEPSPSIPALALVDTGARPNVIRPALAHALQLKPIGTRLVHTADRGNVETEEFLVRFRLPEGVIFEGTAVTSSLEGQPFDCLLGRELLAPWPAGFRRPRGVVHSLPVKLEREEGEEEPTRTPTARRRASIPPTRRVGTRARSRPSRSRHCPRRG